MHIERIAQDGLDPGQLVVAVAVLDAGGFLQPPAQAQRAAQQLVEAFLGRIADGGIERPALGRGLVARCQGQHGIDRLALQDVGCRFVEDGEPGSDVGFERKALQQALAERMDGLHLEPARRLDGHREQRARALDLGRRRPARREIGELVAKLVLRHRHPLRERVVDALRHLGRRGLGVSEREDALRDCPGQHQPQCAQREHVRLAGAGVGAHPGGGARVGGIALGAACALEIRRSRGHGPSSSSATAHSPTRARCA